MPKIRAYSVDRIRKRRKPRRVKSCPYCGRQIGFEWGNYYVHVDACKRKAEEKKRVI